MEKSVSHPISTLDQYQPSGLYWSLGLIWGVILILSCIILYVIHCDREGLYKLYLQSFKGSLGLWFKSLMQQAHKYMFIGSFIETITLLFGE